MRYRWLVLALLVGALAFVAAGCGGGDDDGGAEGSEDVSGSISLMGIWGGEEQESVQAVIDGLCGGGLAWYVDGRVGLPARLAEHDAAVGRDGYYMGKAGFAVMRLPHVETAKRRLGK